MTLAPSPKLPGRLAFWSSVLIAGMAATAFGFGLATPPRSGPFCSRDCVGYPYTDVAAFVPRDFWWMYPAMLVPLVFVVLVACIEHGAAEDRQLVQTGVSEAGLS
jgi:hypothetical protein